MRDLSEEVVLKRKASHHEEVRFTQAKQEKHQPNFQQYRGL